MENNPTKLFEKMGIELKELTGDYSPEKFGRSLLRKLPENGYAVTYSAAIEECDSTKKQ